MIQQRSGPRTESPRQVDFFFLWSYRPYREPFSTANLHLRKTAVR